MPVPVVAKLEDLIGKDLGQFHVMKMTEVYKVDNDGNKIQSLGFLRSETIAKAFAGGVDEDADHHRTAQAFVLANGSVAYILDEKREVTLLSDEAEAFRLKVRALDKLTQEERELLGFKE